ncbi:MAG: PEP-CTERM sorting domain-containing protein [bacterium]|nr:PEP-CTERM sorting domain-containing protein [bacterium]
MRHIAKGATLFAALLALHIHVAFAQVTGFTPPDGFRAIPLGLAGSAIAFSPSGKLAVATDRFGGGAYVTVYDTWQNGRTVLYTVTAPSGANWQFIGALAWKDDDTLAIAENGDEDTLFEAKLSAGTVTKLVPSGTLQNVADVVYDVSSDAYYATLANNPGQGAVVRVRPNEATPVISALGTGYLGGIQMGIDGLLYVGDTNDPFFEGRSGVVWKISPSGLVIGSLSLAGAGGSGLSDLVFDSEGDLIATTQRVLSLLPRASEPAQPFGTFSGAFPFPTSLAFYGTGFEPYVGNGVLLVNGVFTEVGGIFALQPVPEPATLVAVGGLVGMLAAVVRRRKPTLLVALVALASVALSPAQAGGWADRVLGYEAGGAAAGFADPLKALGAVSTAHQPTAPDNSGIVSIGPRGYLILGFPLPFLNGPGYDLIAFGNAFYVGGNINRRYQEPGILEVGIDVNGNGIVDGADLFYRLLGNPNPTFSFAGVIDPGGRETTWGYVDVTPIDGSGNPFLPDDPFTPGITPGSAGGDAFDLDWAVDAQGNPVYVPLAHFVRITSAGNWSPEVDAVAVLYPVPEPATCLSLALMTGALLGVGRFRRKA